MICFINVNVNGEDFIAIEDNSVRHIARFDIDDIVRLNEGSFLVMCVPGGEAELKLYRLMFINQKVEARLIGYQVVSGGNKVELKNELYRPAGGLKEFIYANKGKPIQGRAAVDVSFDRFESLSVDSGYILDALNSIDSELTKAVDLLKKMKMY